MSWIDEFDSLATDEKLTLIHQKAGWKDIKDDEIWRAFVREVVGGYAREGMSVFEAGCGVGSFLLTLRSIVPSIAIHGFDASTNAIAYIKDQLPPSERANVSVGDIPESFGSIGDDTFDLVVANSVFQYLPDLETARRAVVEMMRICKDTGTVIIADVCDAETASENEARMAALWGDAYGSPQRPRFLYFPQEWFLQFRRLGVNVRFARITDERYARRTQRYQVYLGRTVTSGE